MLLPSASETVAAAYPSEEEEDDDEDDDENAVGVVGCCLGVTWLVHTTYR